MSDKYHEQTCASYKNIRYGQGTVYSSGCGPASLCNCLDALGIASVTVKTMCAYSEAVGARVSGGTDVAKLLKAAAGKYGFTYRSTSANAELLSHLRAGGVAILHGGSNYKLFSNGGHFVAAVGVSGNDVTIMDSYWYDGKYIATALRRNNVKVLGHGMIRTSISAIGRATSDRSPSYYLISKSDNKKTQPGKAEEEEKIMYKTIDNVPSWGKPTVQKLLDKGYLTGTGTSGGKAVIDLTETMLRMLVINDRAGLYG